MERAFIGRSVGESVEIAYRREGNEQLKKMLKDKEIGEDQEHTGESEIQMLHDHYIKRIAEILETKEKDILEV